MFVNLNRNVTLRFNCAMRTKDPTKDGHISKLHSAWSLFWCNLDHQLSRM